MRIVVRAKVSAKQTSVQRVTPATLGLTDQSGELVVYKVSVKEPPIDGKANDAISKALATYFDVAPSLVRLISGHTAKQKVFEIDKREN